MKKILVTGGAGYIGSHAVRDLASCGMEPVVFDDLSTGHAEFVRDFRLHQGDLKDKDMVNKVLSDEKPDAVMHFAAYSIVDESCRLPMKYYENNIIGSINLINGMLKHNISRIIFSSTCAVYGEPKYVPIDESHPVAPVNPYGRGKHFIENILGDLDNKGLKSIILRYFNASGAHHSGEIGEAHNPETHLVPLVLDAALKKRECIYIYGDDYDTDDGTCIRDYIHVSDIVKAHILSMDYLFSQNRSNVFNIGSEKGCSVKSIISETERITGRKIVSKLSPRRAGDPSRLIADSSKVRSVLGWRPEHTLESIIGSAYEWHRNNFDKIK